jgi:hypothetical protein
MGPISPAPSATVVVRGLDYACWKCGGATTCVVAVHAEGSRQSGDWLWFEDKHALRFARELLVQSGRLELATPIRNRFSKTAGSTYLSNGCQHCDAIQGDWPLGRAISGYIQTAPLEELSILAAVTVAETTWNDVSANQGMRRHGYPMTWEEMD